MSTTIDQKVVEMRFDNKQFESNVSTTMSTLDKLKQKLNFTGASKSLDGVNSAVKNVNMSPLSSAVQTVGARFSALEVMGVTALANITNSAVNAGKRIVSALTIDPIKTGFQEYETQINAVQTILANTESKGTTIDDVNAALEELNSYADKTIYNFTEMTRNIGTFTAAGVDLDTSVSAIQGIANLAAVSGSTSQQASTAMYQLSQALSSGTVKLMDWNSVVNAGMGGEVFQNALKETARVHGVAIDSMIEEEGSFRETLKDGWLTSEILTETLEKFTMATEGMTKAEIEANRTKLRALGYTEEQIEGIFKLGNTATNAATKVKTFTQLWDVMKESAQSGWSQTWKLIIGDFEEAKALLTPLADFFTEMINKTSEARNRLIEGALSFGDPWGKIVKKLDAAGLGKVKEMAKSVADFTDKVEYFQDIVNKVWRGDYNNSDTGRFEMLEAAGYDHRVVQDLVNKGYQYKITVEDIEASHKKFGLTMDKTSESTKDASSALGALSDEQLKNAGLTDEEIKLYRDLEAEAKRTGVSVEELADKMSKKDGRSLLFDSIKNAGKGLLTTFTAIKDAWVEIFPPMSIFRLYSIIEGINEFSQKLVVSEETADKLKRTFKGVFAIFDIVFTLVGGPLKWAFDAIVTLLDRFDIDILDVTANIGDAVVRLRDWIDANNIFVKGFELISPYIKTAVQGIKDWIAGLKEADNVPKYIADSIMNVLGDIVSGVKNVISNIINGISDGMGGAGGNIISGLANGLWRGIKVVVGIITELAKNVISKFCEMLGIHSPSTVAFEWGWNIIKGLFNGVKEAVKMIYNLFMSIGNKIIEIVKGFNLGTILSAIMSVGIVVAIVKIASAFKSLVNPLAGIGDVLESFSKTLKAVSFAMIAKGVKDMAIAIAILVGAITILTFLKPSKVWMAVGVIAALALVLGGLAFAISKFNGGATDIKQTLVNIGGMSLALLSIGISVLLIAASVKILESVDPENAKQAFLGLAGVILAISAVIAVYGLLVKGKGANNIGAAGKMLMSLATSLLLMVIVVKMVSSLEKDELIKGGIAIGAFTAVVILLMAFSRVVGRSQNVQHLPSILKSFAVALLIMAATAKIIGSMEWGDLGKAGAAVGAFALVTLLLIAMTNKIGKGKKNLDEIGSVLKSVGVAMLLMAVTAKIAGSMEWGELAKGGLAVAAFGGIIVGLMAATKLLGHKGLKHLSVTLISMSIAIGIMAGIAVLLGMVDLRTLAQGVIAVGILAGLVAIMVAATKNATECHKNMIAITAAIAVMAIALVALSFIDVAKLAGAVTAMILVMGMFAIMMQASSSAKGSIGTLIVMTIAIGLLSAALYLIAGMPIKSTLVAAASLAGLMLTFVGVLMLLEKTKGASTKALVSLGVISIVIMIMASSLKKLAEIPTTKALGAAASLLLITAGLSLIFVALGKMSGTVLKSIATVAGIGAVVILLTYALGKLSVFENISWEAIAKGLVAIAGSFLVIGVAGALLQPILPAIMLLGAALAALGLGILALGGGLTLIADAVFAFANGAPMVQTGAQAIVTALTTILIGIASLIPLVIRKIGEGVMAFCQVLIASAPTVMMTIASILTSLLQAILIVMPLLLQVLSTILTGVIQFLMESVPMILEFIGMLLDGIFTFLLEYIPKFVEFVLQLITSLLNALADNIQPIIDAGGDVIMAWMEGMATKIPEVVNKAFECIVTFINGLATAVDKNAARIANAIAKLMKSIYNAMKKSWHIISGAAGEIIDDFMSNLLGAGNWGKLKSAGGKIIEGIKSGVDAVIGTVTGVITTVVDLLTGKISAGDVLAKIKGIGSDIISGIKNGATKAAETIGDIIDTVVSGVKKAASNIGDKFLSIGSNIVKGIKKGFSDAFNGIKGWLEEKMDLLPGWAKELLGINSPSKVFMEIAKWIPEGMKVGIENNMGVVEGAVDDLGYGTINSMSTIMSRLGDALNSDMDFQPTISPVLDLDDVRSGAGTINDLLNGTSILGVRTNVGAISTILNRRNQNGANDDVVSAIDKLRKDLGESDRATYNINGITYDDDSAVTDAIKTIVRAAKVGRRV